MKNILVTGAAGFIGYHLSGLLCAQGHKVVGVDSINDYYDIRLKQGRLRELEPFENFVFVKLDISDREAIEQLFSEYKFDIVINLAAQAGVRYSIENPYQYTQSNVTGFINILEACRHNDIEHLIYASSSSVYGANSKVPFSPDDQTDHPVSLYAATKKANEVMAHSYASLYNIPVTGLRFFTVYGPWGRPDMAYFLFVDAIVNDRPIKLFNNGDMMRDFTYVDDIVKSISLLLDKAPKPAPEKKGTFLKSSESYAPYRVYNIGNNSPVNVKDFLSIIEELVGKKAKIENKPMQPGDVYKTYADIDSLVAVTGHTPEIDIRTGLGYFVDWYLSYYNNIK